MEKIVQREVEYVRNYVRNSAFVNYRNLLRNIRVIQYNVNFEWFNCAIIAMHSKDSDEIVVKTKEGWESVYDVDSLKETGCFSAIYLLAPHYDSQEDEISFRLFPVYYLRAFEVPNNREIKLISNFETVLERERYNSLRIHFKNKKWFIVALKEYMNSFLFYIQASEKEKNFYLGIMQIAFGELLKVDYSTKGFTLPTWDEDNQFCEPIELYKHIHTLITNFHLYMKAFLRKLSSYDERIRELDLIQQPEANLGYEMLSSLEQGEDIERYFGDER